MKHIKLFEDFVNEALSSKKPNEVTTVEVDMGYDDEKEAAKAWKKYNLKVKEIKGGSGAEHEITGKKKDILAYLQSEFYEMDDDTVKEYYPELLEGNSEDEHDIKIHESIDTKYWADYNKDTSGQSDPEYANKSKDFEGTFKEAVKDWNDMGEDPITNQEAEKVKKIAKEFFSKAGWISVNVAQAMIAQES